MEQVLLLNATYEPLQVITWQRAIRLVTLGRVEVVEETDREVRSFSLVVKLPAIVRLLRMIRPRWHAVKFSRANVYLRDNFRCQYCGVTAEAAELNMDHVVPRTMGGATSWENIVTCCVPCNRRKGNRTPELAGMRPWAVPVKPTTLPGISVEIYRRMKKDVPEEVNS
ncbi:MAG: HNH endonuclease [candidate division NC10 bacterium]|nr:HNH endonuclease [candidate division NC10 bacterium]